MEFLGANNVGTLSRFTISLPAELLEEVDDQLVGDDDSRSAVVRRLLEEALRERRRQRDVERYIRGYREQPQTEEEFGWSDVATTERLSEIPSP
jgi:metal-responsive CopG/Arc/MetJ family transcriptional regulator